MNQVFADMIKAYQQRHDLTGLQMWSLTSISSKRAQMIDKGLVPLSEKEALLMMKVFDFTEKEEQIVQGNIEKVKPARGTQTPFGKFMQLYRMKNDMIIGNMARKIMSSTSYASGVEHGRYELKPIYIEKLIEKLVFTEEEEEQLRGFVPQTIIR